MTTTERQDLNTLFHRVWSKAVKTEDYDKEEWKRLERLIEIALEDSSTNLKRR